MVGYEPGVRLEESAVREGRFMNKMYGEVQCRERGPRAQICRLPVVLLGRRCIYCLKASIGYTRWAHCIRVTRRQQGLQ